MENAVEALKQAAAVLIFVIALTASFNMFSKAKETADAVTTSQDSQEYLESAELKDKLYVSSADIESGENTKFTTEGYRIVKEDDVISTLYRYNLEKYGVTIAKENGDIIARYDSNTESIVRQYYNITSEAKKKYIKQLKKNTTIKKWNNGSKLELKYEYNNENENGNSLCELYKLDVTGSNIKCGAPWYGNDTEINKRINADVGGYAYKLNNQKREIRREIGTSLHDELKNKTIVEVVNEIDNSDYLKDDNEADTSLLQQYELPTVEIVYIIK